MSVKFCTVGFQLFSGKASLYIYDTQLASLGSSLLPSLGSVGIGHLCFLALPGFPSQESQIDATVAELGISADRAAGLTLSPARPLHSFSSHFLAWVPGSRTSSLLQAYCGRSLFPQSVSKKVQNSLFLDTMV